MDVWDEPSRQSILLVWRLHSRKKLCVFEKMAIVARMESGRKIQDKVGEIHRVRI